MKQPEAMTLTQRASLATFVVALMSVFALVFSLPAHAITYNNGPVQNSVSSQCSIRLMDDDNIYLDRWLPPNTISTSKVWERFYVPTGCWGNDNVVPDRHLSGGRYYYIPEDPNSYAGTTTKVHVLRA